MPRFPRHTTLRWSATRSAIAGALAIGLTGVALIDASPASAVSPAPVCVGTACTITFSTPGVGQSWVVPTGVTSASFALYGAVGGSEGSIPGGDGAKITGTLSVLSGSSLTIDVGGAGSNGFSTGGGVNGGGVGGFGSDGGGGSDVKVGGVDQLAAGGGGGAGESGGGAACTSPASVSGGLGGNADTAGGPGGALTVGVGPGAGTLGGGQGASPGTTVGGAGGTGGVASFNTTTCGANTVTAENGGSGAPGSANQGGLGGGGGGGGGYFGGGGGGNRSGDNNNPFSDNAGGGGGGGGSSFGIAGSDFVLVSDTANPSDRSFNGGNGEVMISYTIPTVAPTVTTQPTSQSAPSGGTLTFTAGASGTPTPTVQWQYSIDGGSTWANITIAGATSPTLTAGSVTALVNGWQVRAVFTNAGGTATSNAATITITPAPALTTVKAAATSSSSGTPALAVTGFNAWRLVDIGALMVATGSAFVALSRRRRRVIPARHARQGGPRHLRP